MRIAVAVVVLWLSLPTVARAESYVVRASSGELVESPKPCGPLTRDEIWKFVGADLILRTADNSIRYAQTNTTYEGIAADKVYVQDGATFGIWYRGRRSIVIALRPLTKIRKLSLVITFLVEKDERSRTEVSCFERWVGSVDS